MLLFPLGKPHLAGPILFFFLLTPRIHPSIHSSYMHSPTDRHGQDPNAVEHWEISIRDGRHAQGYRRQRGSREAV